MSGTDPSTPPALTTVDLGNGFSLQYGLSAGGVTLLVNGPGLVGSNGAVVVTEQQGTGVAGGPDLPGFGIYVGPVQYAGTALGPYIPV